jgi:hypothetical protein
MEAEKSSRDENLIFPGDGEFVENPIGPESAHGDSG